MGNTEQIHQEEPEKHQDGAPSTDTKTVFSAPTRTIVVDQRELDAVAAKGRQNRDAAAAAEAAADLPPIPTNQTIVMDQRELDAVAAKGRQTRAAQDSAEGTKAMTPYGGKSQSRITLWLQHLRTSLDLRTTTDFDDHSKVDMDTLADINASIDMQDHYSNLADNFDIEKPIAAGGQGSIAQAYDKHCARTVAIKTLHKKLDKSETARRLFLTEAQITAQLEHPSIIPIYGIYGDEENGLHLAMKLVHGRSLQEYLNYICERYEKGPRDYIRRCESENLKKRLGYFINVVDAISYVHHKNVIHKDLKPENIMLGAFGETYVMDWGISEKVDNEHKPKKPSGTLQYIAPEVINMQPYDTRSDIYLLGLILYDITFLKPAYESSNNAEAIRMAKSADIGPYRHRYGCTVDPDLVYIIDKALAVNPDDRYQKAELLGKDIRAYLQGDVVSASPYQRLSRVFKYLRSHVKMLFILFVILLALFFGTNFFFINKAYGASQRKLREKNMVTHLATSSARSAENFENALRSCERALQDLALETYLRLDMTDRRTIKKPSRAMVPYDQTPQDAVYSPTYGFSNVSFDATAYKAMPGTPQEDIDFYLSALEPMFGVINRAMLELSANQEVLKGMERNDVIMYMTQHKRPVVYNVYLGLENGMVLSYPFVSGLKADYDPRTRPWYTAATACASGAIAIADPYLDKAKSSEAVFTMSIPLRSSAGELQGVLALDISEDFLRERIGNSRSRQMRSSRNMVVNRQGQILVDTGEKLHINSEGTRPAFYTFPDKDVFGRFSSLKNASIMVEHNGLQFLYVYTYIKAVDWYYVERINFSKYMDLN